MTANRKIAAAHIGGGPTKTMKAGGFTGTYIDQKGRDVNMAGSDRPGGMDNVPSKMSPGRRSPDKTDMGKVARIAHVERKDRVGKVTRGVNTRDTGGGHR